MDPYPWVPRGIRVHRHGLGAFRAPRYGSEGWVQDEEGGRFPRSMPGHPATPESITWVGLDRRLKCSSNGGVVSLRRLPVLFPFDVAFHPTGLRSTSSFPSRARGSVSDASIFPSDEPHLPFLHVDPSRPHPFEPRSLRVHRRVRKGFPSGSKGNPHPSTNDEGVRVKKKRKNKTKGRDRVVLSSSCCVVLCCVWWIGVWTRDGMQRICRCERRGGGRDEAAE